MITVKKVVKHRGTLRDIMLSEISKSQKGILYDSIYKRYLE